ncbi:unnamed protein product [Euphydryas editha]|uniref:Uncharacterized protein n=1 Tax=Euphydryas editha TaxID=104508 RepID=A0AAU9TZZ7_EUPED|nr:unnamed protein product [Euphydryas editha]
MPTLCEKTRLHITSYLDATNCRELVMSNDIIISLSTSTGIWCLGVEKHKIEFSDLWWKETFVQPQVKENDSTKILWEMPVHTDVTVRIIRPDLIYVDKNNNKTF